MKTRSLRFFAPASVLMLAVTAFGPPPAAVAEEGATAKGTVVYKGRTIAVRYAYLVKGPDAVDAKQVIRRVVLSPTDIGDRIRACSNMSCSDGDLREGMTVDYGSGPRLNYWVVMNDQRIQYSGTVKPEAFTARTDDGRRISGRLSFNDSGAGGPTVEVELDATLVKEFRRKS
ncbi:MAG: hypothetical protein M3167_03480 [Acidobacteriota bacterium]|nr:hypothetical protein [Acidobacteriota bacterium]